jgi:NAD(P)-dependent dehydrogenase (short-subunit alcohol dehydrogenase family)
VAARLIDRIAGEAGPPDVLVNTIGAFRPEDVLATTPEMLRLMLDVNLGPALWLTQAVEPHMQQQGSGAIVHVAARPGIEAAGGMAAYGVSKAAVRLLTAWPAATAAGDRPQRTPQTPAALAISDGPVACYVRASNCHARP